MSRHSLNVLTPSAMAAIVLFVSDRSASQIRPAHDSFPYRSLVCIYGGHFIVHFIRDSRPKTVHCMKHVFYVVKYMFMAIYGKACLSASFGEKGARMMVVRRFRNLASSIPKRLDAFILT